MELRSAHFMTRGVLEANEFIGFNGSVNSYAVLLVV